MRNGQRARGVDRRAFLRMAGASTLGFSVLVEACTAPAPAAAPTSRPAAPPAVAATPAAGRKLQLPNYAPVAGAQADLPPTPEGLQAGYFAYPKSLGKTVKKAPGLGGDVTALTSLPFAPPPPIEDNPAWQAINKELNANMKVRMVPSGDYANAVATTMAGGDLPDLFYFNAFGPTTADLPQFLKTAYTDVTPFLAGDAITDYPNLAAFPTASWIPTVFDGALFGVPVVRPPWNYVWYVNQTWLGSIGASAPANADDF